MTAALYDFDGLLIDSETAGLLSWRKVYAEFGHEVDLEYWLAETSAGRGPCMPKRQLEELTGTPIDWEAVEPERLRWRDELLVPRPGALEHLLQAEALGMPKAIVSNAPDWWVTEQLARTGIEAERFDVIITKASALAKKPAPDSYLAALERLGVPAGDAVAFEDSPIGIVAAQAAEIKCVAVPNLVTRHLDLSGADLVIPSLAARSLEELVGDLLAGGRPAVSG